MIWVSRSKNAICLEALYSADEVFMTGTAAEITPVRSVDRMKVGHGQPGPVTRALRDAFFGLFDGRTPDRYGWLMHVSRAGTAEQQATHGRTSHTNRALPESTAKALPTSQTHHASSEISA
jgi:branched-chain amino acid aminotransferase